MEAAMKKGMRLAWRADMKYRRTHRQPHQQKENTVTTTQFTVKDVLAALKAAAEDRGDDYIYPPSTGSGICRYRWTETDVEQAGHVTAEQIGKPSCIAGHVMAQWGILDDVIEPYMLDDGGIDFSYNEDAIADIGLRYSGYVTAEAQVLLEQAQRDQDQGLSWGVTYRRAQAVAEALFA